MYARRQAYTDQKPYDPVLDPFDPINRGLMACFVMGDTAGSKPIKDLSPYRNRALANGGPISNTRSHHGGVAPRLVGASSQSYSTKNNLVIAAGQPFCLSVWAAPSTAASQTNGAPRVFSWNEQIFFLLTLSNGTDTFYASNDGGTFLQGGVIYNPSVWSHFVYRCDGSSTGTIWFNGVQVASGSVGASTPSVNGKLDIGDRASNGGGRQVDGSIDGVRVYVGRYLSDSDIVQLYRKPWAGIVNASSLRRRSYRAVVAGGSTQNITMTTAALMFAGLALGANAKTQTSIAKASLTFAGFVLGVSAGQVLSVARAGLTFSGQALAVNAKTMTAVSKAALTWTGAALSANAKTMTAMAQAALLWTGRALGANAKTTLTVAQASLSWAGRALTITGTVSIVFAQATIVFGGRVLNFIGTAGTRLMQLLGVGQ